MRGAALLLALLPAAWLLPNHYPPWVSAWHEGLAITLLALAALQARRPASVPRLWLAAAALALGSIAAQAATGHIYFSGDALMAGTYVGMFVLAMAVGNAVVQAQHSSADPGGPLLGDVPALIALGTVAAATACVAIALVQWTDIAFARLWIVDLPPRGRPFSNLAQANHFGTASFLGLAALAVLREGGRVGPPGFWVGAAFMLLGMFMSGSRTAWVHLGLAAAMCAWYGPRLRLRLRWTHVAALVLLGLALQLAWSSLDGTMAKNVLRPTANRPMSDKLDAGARPAVWRDMTAAIAREPLWGHGWQQVGAAQQSIALDRPPVAAFQEHFDRAHNIALDLLLWAGIPVGAAILLLCTLALWQQLRRLSDPRAVWLMTGALALLAHAMLEFPLEFAYFLIPLGVTLGVVQALSRPAGAVSLPRWALPVGGAALAVALVVVAMDYLRAEENFRMLRLETARVGTTRVVSEVPELRVLDQLEAFLHLVRSEATPGMTPAELERMRLVSQRYGMAPVLFRYALALGLNGRPEEAARTLKRICHIHAIERCQEAREAWPTMQQRHEALRAVPPP